jgi:hypothetical protein
MRHFRRLALTPVIAFIALGLSACGSGGGDSTAASDTQSAKDRVFAEAGPYRPDQGDSTVLYRAVQTSPDTVVAFRKLMAAATQEIGGYWIKTVPAIYGAQYRPPRFVGGYDPANGASVTCGGRPSAIPGNAFFCIPDNYIAWDEPGLMIPLLKRGVLAPVFVLAHEWGHSVQNELHVSFSEPIERELNADCLAGAWARDAAARGKLNREDFDSAVELLRQVQDAPGVPWADSDAHGTAFERIDHFGKGVDGGPIACLRPSGQPTGG